MNGREICERLPKDAWRVMSSGDAVVSDQTRIRIQVEQNSSLELWAYENHDLIGTINTGAKEIVDLMQDILSFQLKKSLMIELAKRLVEHSNKFGIHSEMIPHLEALISHVDNPASVKDQN